MSKKPNLAKPFKKFEEDLKPQTERLAFQTDRIIEQSIDSDISFTKEESYSINNLKQD